MIISLYVDDLTVTGSNCSLILKFKEDMKKEFEMTDVGFMNYFIGMEINQPNEGIFVCQEKYVKNLLKKYNMEGCKAVDTPLVLNQQLTLKDGAPRAHKKLYRRIIGSLL